MSSIEKSDFFCDHCNALVSKSTFRRHQLLVNKKKVNNLYNTEHVDSSDSLDESSSDESHSTEAGTEGKITPLTIIIWSSF